MVGAAFRFYHDQLPDDNWRDFYNKVEAAVRSRAPKLIYTKVLSTAIRDYSRVLTYVYSDHPELFYFNSYGCKYGITDSQVTVEFCYCETLADMQSKTAAVERVVDRILAECFPMGVENASELRREKKIFDWLTDNVTYDHDSLQKYSKRMDILGDAWTAYGALVLKKAVCQGIACAFKLLCDRMNLPSIVVVGDGGGRHAWNIVRIDNRFYEVDATWTLKNSIDLTNPFKRYEYLNVTDDIMHRTHTPDDAFLPKCTSLKANPYRIKDLCCKDLNDLTQKALKHAADGENRFAFLCLAGYPGSEDQKAVAQKIADSISGSVTWYCDPRQSYYIGYEITRRN